MLCRLSCSSLFSVLCLVVEVRMWFLFYISGLCMLWVFGVMLKLFIIISLG